MRIEPEFGAALVVMIGHFNPSIFSPLWFQKVGLASEKEADEAKITMIHPEFAMFKLGTKEIQVRLDRFSAQTSEAPWVSLADFVATTFGEFLPHTPISSLGINRFVHFKVGSEIIRNRIGRILAPTKPWGEWGAEIEKTSTGLLGGFTVLSMQQPWWKVSLQDGTKQGLNVPFDRRQFGHFCPCQSSLRIDRSEIICRGRKQNRRFSTKIL